MLRTTLLCSYSVHSDALHQSLVLITKHYQTEELSDARVWPTSFGFDRFGIGLVEGRLCTRTLAQEGWLMILDGETSRSCAVGLSHWAPELHAIGGPAKNISAFDFWHKQSWSG